MKEIKLLFTLFLLITTSIQAQVPPIAFNYSAVARDAAGEPIATTTIGVQVSILQSSTIGSAIYVENHFVNTDDFGLFNLIIGAGAAQTGTMGNIAWNTDEFYLQIGMDANGGTNFLTMGTTQLLSVPYALHAATADSLIGGEPSFSGDYNDLSNQPITISSMSQNGDSLLLSNGQVYTSSNDYNDLINQPENLSSFINDTEFISVDNDQQSLTVSQVGDTLFISSGNWVIIPGISTANYIYTPGDGVTDNSGNFYTSVIIGNQEWLGKNLRTTKYANGDPITFVPTICHNGDYPIKSYAYFEEDSSNTELHGLAYTGRATTDTRNVCPVGWHLPSQQEYEILISELGGISQAGTKMKMVGFGNGTNESGLAFTAVGESDLWTPGSAYCSPDYLYGTMFLGAPAYYWTASAGGWEELGQNALMLNGSGVQWYIGDDAGDFHGVRCVKD